MTTQETTVMTTQDIAARLTLLCRKGDWETAQKELYDDNAVSIEPFATPYFEKETKGLQAIFEKGHKFNSTIEAIHGITVSEPLITAILLLLSLI